MNECIAWIMVVSKVTNPSKQTVFSAGDTIRDKLGFKEALEVIGPYDVVAEARDESLQGLYETTKLIAELDTVASTTTYISVRQGKGKSTERPKCCILLEVVLKYIDSIFKTIMDLDEVVRADIILGPFDMIILANVDLANLSGFLNNLFKKTQGIARSITLPELPES